MALSEEKWKRKKKEKRKNKRKEKRKKNQIPIFIGSRNFSINNLRNNY